MNYPEWLTDESESLIYFGDPMCSWCYGISKELNTLRSEFSEIPSRIILGGLRPYNTEEGADMADFLKHHWEQVHTRTELPFDYTILQEKGWKYDTEPGSRAVKVCQLLAPEKAFDFFEAIQVAFYANGKNPTELATFLEIAGSLGVDETEFEKKFNSDEVKEIVKNDFLLAQEVGVRSFPSIVHKKGKALNLVAQGYAPATEIAKRMRS